MENLANAIPTIITEWGKLLPQLISGTVVFVVFMISSYVAKESIKKACKVANIDENVIILLSQSARYSLLAIGIVTALGVIGLDVSALVASFGLTGFAVGFALKDTISNTLAGVMILLYRPFYIQDTIKIDAFSGVVINVDLRYTTLKDEENTYFVPNSLVFSKGITVKNKS
jgi:small conductance mechanosensitive channel